ncbi:MAG: SecDF P1 head subdomain-containing protein [Solirubrobacteraceae bacterium]
MIADDPILIEVAAADPAGDRSPGGEAERAQARRILARVLSEPPPARRSWRRRGAGALAPVIAVLVALAVVVAIVRIGTAGSGSPAGGPASLTLVLRALPTPQVPVVTSAALGREAEMLNARLRSVGSNFRVTRAGRDRLTVVLHGRAAAAPAQTIDLLTRPAQLELYDWEANVLMPNGQTVADQLRSGSRAATLISQGTNRGAGMPGAGGLSLYDAVSLASKQPVARADAARTRSGPDYYLFGAPGSSACAAAASANGTIAARGQRCLLAGPSATLAGLDAGLPDGVSASEGQLLTVPQGTVVLQAMNVSGAAVSRFEPSARFYVLRDRVSLTGADIVDPRPSVDAGGNPDVQFRFKADGELKFQRVTAALSHRAEAVSLDGRMLDQHFAIAIDNQLLTVPQIDFRAYPDGIIGGGGADITGGLTRNSARALARELRLGALPLALRVQRTG